MKGLLKKNELRQLLLIETLHNHSDPLSLTDMANILGYSERSIALDISAIQEKFPFIDLKLIHKSITMELPPAYNLSYIYQIMFKENSGVKLLERLFLYKNTHLNDLINLLELSQATIYSLIERVNGKIYTYYDIRIDTNPFRLTGDEEKIRVFFSQLFSNTYTPFEWPFFYTDEASVAELVIRISKAFEVPLNYIGINYLKYLVAVNVVRLKQGYNVPADQEKADTIYQILKDRLFMSDRMAHIFNVLGLPLNQNTIKELFHVLINSDYIFPDYSHFIGNYKYVDTRTKSFNSLKYVIESLTKEFSLIFDNSSDVILNLHNTAMLNHRDIDSGNIIKDDKKDFIEELASEFPVFISRTSFLFKDYFMKMDIDCDDFSINRLIHHLFIHWKSLYTQLIKKNIINVAIICNYDANHAIFLKEYFEAYFGKKINFNIYDDVQVSISRLRCISEPIILSTFHITPIEGKYIVNINFFPSSKDLDKLYSVLKKMK